MRASVAPRCGLAPSRSAAVTLDSTPFPVRWATGLSKETRGAALSGAPEVDGKSVGLAPRRVGLLAGVAATVLVVDVVSKIVAVAELTRTGPIGLIDGLLTLRLTRNPGAAFGIAEGATVLFTLVALGVIAAIVRAAPRLRSPGWAVAFGLLLGGAAGNLVDRLLRSPGPFRGHVVDWIALPHWPVFNVADAAIVTGGALAVLLAMRGAQVDGTRQR